MHYHSVIDTFHVHHIVLLLRMMLLPPPYRLSTMTRQTNVKELILTTRSRFTSERLDDAFARFREWYDMVIVDTEIIVNTPVLLG